jgi:hypothetical protein
MGRAWIDLDEVVNLLPKRCPNCGGHRFVIEGARKVEFEAVYEATDEGARRMSERDTGCEWEVAYGVACADCGEDLGELVGF